MQNSYLLAGIKAGRLIRMAVRNGGISMKYIPRMMFLTNAGLWSEIFALVEKRRYGRNPGSEKNLLSPVFIVGNWRTGTTLLHQLLSVDPQFSTPTVFQVSNPDHFLVSKKYYVPVMSKVLGDKRPMDNVKIGIDEPQEDEYALLKLCSNTPLEGLLFQSKQEFFLDGYKDFFPEDEAGFSEAIQSFALKLTANTKQRPLFKNPFHSLRIPLLKKLFPGARFIHIYRNPHDVIPSSIHMWNIIGPQNILKGKWVPPQPETIAEIYRNIITSVRYEFDMLDTTKSIEIRFEDLEKDTVNVIRQIYKQLGLTFSPEYEESLREYSNELKAHKKNTYTISPKYRDIIKDKLSLVLPEYF